jgi:hypothetical protein
MNRNQRYVLIGTAGTIALMFLFPPFALTGSYKGTRYGFLFLPPETVSVTAWVPTAFPSMRKARSREEIPDVEKLSRIRIEAHNESRTVNVDASVSTGLLLAQIVAALLVGALLYAAMREPTS